MSKESGIDTSVAGPSHAATTSSDTDTDSSTAGSFMRPAEKRARKQAFRKSWLQDPQFQLWLGETEDPLQAKCTVCNKRLRAAKHVLKDHASTATHSTNMRQKGTSISGPRHAAATSSDAETDSNDSSSARSIKRRSAQKARKQPFCKFWLQDPQFQSWLGETEDPLQAKCTVCNKYLTAAKHVLKDHASTVTHSTNMRQKGTSISGPRHAAATSSDAETDSSSARSFMRPAEKRATTQAFRKSWLRDPQFQSWLQEAADSYKARCAACCINVCASKSVLQRHAQSLKHIRNYFVRRLNSTTQQYCS